MSTLIHGLVRKPENVTTEPIAAGKGASRQVLLGPAEGLPNFFVRKFRMETGGGMPMHTNTVEHGQYILSGEADLVVGGETKRVKAGDSVYIPANIAHSYTVAGAHPFEFICIVPNLPDKTALV